MLSIFLLPFGSVSKGLCNTEYILCIVVHDNVIKWKYFLHCWSCGESTGHRWFLHGWPVMRSFDVFCDVSLNKLLNQSAEGQVNQDGHSDIAIMFTSMLMFYTGLVESSY